MRSSRPASRVSQPMKKSCPRPGITAKTSATGAKASTGAAGPGPGSLRPRARPSGEGAQLADEDQERDQQAAGTARPPPSRRWRACPQARGCVPRSSEGSSSGSFGGVALVHRLVLGISFLRARPKGQEVRRVLAVLMQVLPRVDGGPDLSPPASRRRGKGRRERADRDRDRVGVLEPVPARTQCSVPPNSSTTQGLIDEQAEELVGAFVLCLLGLGAMPFPAIDRNAADIWFVQSEAGRSSGGLGDEEERDDQVDEREARAPRSRCSGAARAPSTSPRCPTT